MGGVYRRGRRKRKEKICNRFRRRIGNNLTRSLECRGNKEAVRCKRLEEEGMGKTSGEGSRRRGRRYAILNPSYL